MRNILFLILICISYSLSGQRTAGNIPKIKFTGQNTDQETQQPLEYATISLRNPNNLDRLQGGITGFDGKFSIEIFPGVMKLS